MKSTIVYGSPGVANNLLPTSLSSGSGDGNLTATASQTYDIFGNLLTVDGPLPSPADTTRLRYDAARRLVGVVGPDPDGVGVLKHRAQRLTFNGDGNITKIETGTVNGQSDVEWNAFSSLQAAEFSYDTLGRKQPTRSRPAGQPTPWSSIVTTPRDGSSARPSE